MILDLVDFTMQLRLSFGLKLILSETRLKYGRHVHFFQFEYEMAYNKVLICSTV